MKILVVDDEIEILHSIRRSLKYKGIDTVEVCDSSKKAAELIRNNDFDVVLLDILMPEMDGLDVLESGKLVKPLTEFIIITGVSSIETAVKAISLGAYDYLVKPLDPSRLMLSIERAYEKKALSTGFSAISREHPDRDMPEAFSNIITRDPKMCSLIRYADIMARSGKSILITGESGTGKELFARSIHQAGPYAQGPFVPVNVSSIPETLFESQLFGHAKGAFTTATSETAGYFESARGGLLLLDEIGELPSGLQAKLLRVLEDRQITRVGETRPRHITVQIVSATNKDIFGACQAGVFRFDLYFRLSSAKIHIPPLRDRRGDIPFLADHFLKKACAQYEKTITGISPEALEMIGHLDLPGNARELEHLIENAVILSDGPVLLPRHFADFDAAASSSDMAPPLTIKENETAHIAHVLKAAHGDRKAAAALLGISLRQLHRKLAAMKQSRQWPELF